MERTEAPPPHAGTNGVSNHSLEMANSNQDLVARSKAKQARKWKILGVAIAVVVTLGVAATVVVILNGHAEEDVPKGESFTVDDLLSRSFSPKQFNATWISDSELYYDEGSAPIVLDVHSRNKKSILNATALDYGVFQTELSADRRYALEAYGYRSVYRHSFVALYNIIDLRTGLKAALTVGTQTSPVPAQLVVWGPVGSALLIVAGNDIYYRSEALAPSVRITTSGLHETIYNGVPDWVYEEEVLSSNKAVWFSPDGKRFAFATYNDTQVPLVTLPYYGKPGDLRFQYPRSVNIRYPKVGVNNPSVTLSVYDATTGTVVTVDPPKEVQSSLRSGLDLPVLAVSHWIPDQPEPRLLTVWMNREQNRAVIRLASIQGAAVSQTLVADIREPRGWVDLFEEATTSPTAYGSLLLPLSQPVGNDSFRHVARLDSVEGGGPFKMTFLTNGTFVVSSILSWDHANGYVYFVSSAADDPCRSLVQRVKDSVAGAPHEPECLSCKQADCLHATASLSKSNSFTALTCSGPKVPYIVILDNKASGKKVMDWETNDVLRKDLADKRMPSQKRMTVPLPDGGKAQVMLWLPPDADLSGSTKYPMVVNVYGGPNTARVSERFAVDWGTALSSNKSIIYAAIDGRGSSNKGDGNVFSIYHRFGTYEVEDQINVTRYLQEKLGYVDADKTAIWGWSYGGYVSAMALAEDTRNVFKCGISVAPVTDWMYYDSIYTERYMGLPSEGDNLAYYKRAQLTNKVEGMRNKLFLLVHGTFDDNVHYQQSMVLARALEESDILFRQQSYPDEEHSIGGLTQHLYHTLQNFVMECFE